MFVELLLRNNEGAALAYGLLGVYLLTLYTVLWALQDTVTTFPHKSSTALTLGLAALAGLPPSPVFFFKLWITQFSGTVGPLPVFLTVTFINILTVCLYVFMLKRVAALKYKHRRSASTSPQTATRALVGLHLGVLTAATLILYPFVL